LRANMSAIVAGAGPLRAGEGVAECLIRAWTTDEIFRFGPGQAAAKGTASTPSITSSQRAASGSDETTRPPFVNACDTYNASLSTVRASPTQRFR
jgi:hypothetical protein